MWHILWSGYRCLILILSIVNISYILKYSIPSAEVVEPSKEFNGGEVMPVASRLLIWGRTTELSGPVPSAPGLSLLPFLVHKNNP